MRLVSVASRSRTNVLPARMGYEAEPILCVPEQRAEVAGAGNRQVQQSELRMASGTETRSVVAAIAIAVAVAVSGCGGSSKAGPASASRSTSTTKQQQPAKVTVPSGGPKPLALPRRRRKLAVANIALSSAAITQVAGAGREVDRETTCDGADRSPALKWRGIPANAAELTLFVLDLQPVNHKLFFDWAVAGLSPKLKGLEAGRLPPGAVVGRNGFGHTGYSICQIGRAHV